MKILYILLSLSFLYSNSLKFNHHIENSSVIGTLGNSVPTNLYDSYASNGFTFKIVYEKPIQDNANFRYNFGWQNIYFGENVVSYDSWNGYQIREGEKANLFDVGVKFILNEGLNGGGLFRPYINGSVGFGFFKQYTVYDAPNTWENTCNSFFSTLLQVIFSDGCDTYLADNESTVVNDRMYSPFMTIDLGTQFAFKNPSRYAIEFGVRYSLIKNIKTSEWQNWSNIENEESFVDMVGRKLNADYKTIYFGLSWYLTPLKKSNSGSSGHGRQI